MAKKGISFDNTSAVKFNDEYYILAGQNHNEASCWYKVAHENYCTAEILLKNNKIPPCIFYLQQCSECLTKACLLSVYLTNYNSLRNISHSPDAAFDFIFEELGDVDNHDLSNCAKSEIFSARLKDVVSKWHTLLSEFLDNDRNALERSKDFEMCKEAEIIYRRPTKEFISALPHFVREDFVKLNNANIYKSHIRQVYIQKSMYLFSKLMRGTEANSRYPDNKLILPKYIYTEDLKDDLSDLFIHLYNLFEFISVEDQIQYDE